MRRALSSTWSRMRTAPSSCTRCASRRSSTKATRPSRSCSPPSTNFRRAFWRRTTATRRGGICRIRQLAAANGRFTLITADGRVATCDQRLQNLNFNQAIKDAHTLVTLVDWNDAADGPSPTTLAMRVAFERGVELADDDETALVWRVEPSMAIGDTITKVRGVAATVCALQAAPSGGALPREFRRRANRRRDAQQRRVCAARRRPRSLGVAAALRG